MKNKQAKQMMIEIGAFDWEMYVDKKVSNAVMSTIGLSVEGDKFEELLHDNVNRVINNIRRQGIEIPSIEILMGE